MLSNSASLQYTKGTNTNWTQFATKPIKEKTVVISPYKPMTEEEAQAVKTENAADRAFKIEELKAQAKKVGIPDYLIRLLEDKPYNCEINKFTKTLKYTLPGETKEYTFKNNKVQKSVNIYNLNGCTEKVVGCHKYAPKTFNRPYIDSEGKKHNETINVSEYDIITQYVDYDGSGHFRKMNESIVGSRVGSGDMQVLKSTDYNSDGSIAKPQY